MIAERRSQLFASQEKWRHRSPLTPTHSPSGGIQNRLEALTSSSEDWRKRITKDDVPFANRRSKENLMGRLIAAKDAEKAFQPQTHTPSKAASLHSYDAGLKGFFSAPPACNVSSSRTISNGDKISELIDLDAIKPTQRLVTPRRPIARPGRTTLMSNRAGERLRNIETELIKMEEDPRDHLVLEVIENDTNQKVATSAKRGLEAKEDYSAAKSCLKQAEAKSPFPDVMLIRVKGEKKVDVRLVCPIASSVHQSACFVLVTPTKLFLYLGAESNILERTKATQITTNIVQKKDLFCQADHVERVDGNAYSFFKTIGGGDPGTELNLPLEPFELLICEVNLVLRVTDDYKLQSVAKGERVSFQMLQPNETLIFDFGSELYVWSGRTARKTNAKYAVEYAQQLMNKGLFCQDTFFGCNMKDKRPEWTIYRRVFQGVQDTLFASKFSDWQTSETKHMFKTLSPPKSEVTPRRDPASDAVALAEYLLSLEHPDPKIVLEDVEFGRQTKDIITEGLKFWTLRGEQLEEIENTDVFSSFDCYVVRWQYRIQLSGVRRLKDGSESEKETGRERFAYFYWLGRNTTAKMQGLCALKLSHMDRDKRPQIRIVQGEECAVFLELFMGQLIITSKSKEAPPFFLIRGAFLSEGSAEQLDDDQPLRGHAVYLEAKAGTAPVLHVGAHCEDVHVQIGLRIAKKMKSLKMCAEEETIDRVQGDDNSLKWISVPVRNRTPRMYRLFDIDGEEIFSPVWYMGKGVVFPQHSQSVLRDTVLIDVGEALWLWTEQPPSTHALMVADRFWKGRKGSSIVVEKGMEPLEFQSLFPRWREWEIEDGKENSLRSPVQELKACLASRLRTFSLDQLRSRTDLPPGMDTSRLDVYLSEEDFEKVFKMNRNTFDALPQWKQIRMRKDAALF